MDETKYTAEDFLTTTAPYEAVYKFKDDPFQHGRQLELVSKQANSIGFRSFKKQYTNYVNSLRKSQNIIYSDKVTQFEGQPIELNSGDWEADECGVCNRTGLYAQEACVHPIMPVERLVNIDTGIEKLKLAFRKGKQWRYGIWDKKMLASMQSIIGLADMGIAVNSENAKYLVKYLHDIENLNYEILPEKKSVSRLGYIENEGFAPFVDGIVFDGDLSYKFIFEAIKSKGKRDKWVQIALKVRQSNVMARIVLASAFASVLVEPLGVLPFFVHLWGGESGSGKTVALMLAASVWADPYIGKYIQTFNSTVVGREKLAGFLNHLPLMIDELQLAKDSHGKLAFSVYELAEGVGKTRGTKTGGVERTQTWANCIISTGEAPITNLNSGAGAVNRVIEIECKTSEKIIQDGHKTANELKANYGFVGREFVEFLYHEGNIARALELYQIYFEELSKNNTTEKQAIPAALILVADAFITTLIFKDERNLTVEDIKEFLQTKASVSAGDRGYKYMCDWVSQNGNKFREKNETSDTYGVIENDFVYIINSVFHKAVGDGGYSSVALLSYLKQNGLIQTRGRANTKNKRINGIATECIVIKLPNDGEIEDLQEAIDDGLLPF